MSLRQELYDRSKNYTLRTENLSPRRAALLVWSDTDAEADSLCRKTEAAFPNLFFVCPFHEAPEPSLSQGLDTLAKQHKEGAIVCPEGIFLLWVSSSQTLPANLAAITASPLPLQTASCLLTKHSPTLPAGSGMVWCVDPGLMNAQDTLAALILNGMLQLNFPCGKPQIPVRVRATLHNSVGRDLARQLRDRLETMTCQDMDEERFRQLFGPTEGDCRSIQASLPGLQDLPIVGSEFLSDQPVFSCILNLFPFFRNAEEKDRQATSAREILQKLFGSLENKEPHIWLLDRLRNVLPELCQKRISQFDLEQKFYCQPLGLLTGGAAELALRFRTQAENQWIVTRNRLEEALDATVYPSGSTPDELLSSICHATSLWTECAHACLETAWWEEVSKFLRENSELSKIAQDKLQEFQRGLVILNQMDLPPFREPADFAVNWRTSTLATLLDGLYSQADFTQEDFSVLISQIRHRAPFRAVGFDKTILLYDASLWKLLKGCSDKYGYPLFEEQDHTLVVQGNAGRVVAQMIPGLGRKLLWEVQISYTE